MKKHIYDHTGMVLLRVEQATPKHGEDFCDTCGECLSHYGGDPCYGSGADGHYWVEYEAQTREGDKARRKNLGEIIEKCIEKGVNEYVVWPSEWKRED